MIAALVDAVEDRLASAVIRLGDFDYGAQVAGGMEGALPGVGNVLRRIFGLRLGSQVGGVHRSHDTYAQQEPKKEIEFACGAVGHGSGTLS
jgi:hypothetical protein